VKPLFETRLKASDKHSPAAFELAAIAGRRHPEFQGKHL